MNEDILALANEAAGLEDQTETKGGGDYEYTPPAAGVTVARLIEYIELGKHPQKPWQGQAKQPAHEVRLTFELLHPTKNIKEVEIEGVKTKISETISLKLTKKLGERAKFKKIFDQMRYGRDNIKHFAQMLNNEFIVTVVHNTVEKDGKKNTYANLNDAQGTYFIGAPFVADPLAGTSSKVNVPESIRGLKLFLWDNPKQKSWDSLFIDGTSEIKKPDGTVEHRSKNWLQALILSAVDFKGSALDQLLEGVSELKLTEDTLMAGSPAAGQPVTSTEKPAEALPLPEATKVAPAASTAATDDLAALGLI